MTPELKGEFESSWRDLHPRLRALLAARRISPDRHEDLIQETALRLYGMWERVDQTRPSWPLAKTIVLNLVRDEFRTKRITEPLEASPEKAFDYDLEAQGIARIELERVRVALASLSELQRRALLVEIGVHPAGVAAPVDKMTRSRARKRLASLLQDASALVSLRWLRIPDLLHGAGLLRGAGTAGIACFACLFGASVIAIGAGPLATDAGARPTEAARVASGGSFGGHVDPASATSSVLLRDAFLETREGSGKADTSGAGKGSRAGGSASASASSSNSAGGGGSLPGAPVPSVPDLTTPGGSPEEVPGVPSVPVTTTTSTMPGLPPEGESGPPALEVERAASAVVPLSSLESDLPKV